MAIATYPDLQNTIADYLARADLTTRIPDFIALAESHFNRELRTREMVGGSLLTIASGSVTLPADFLEWISAIWINGRTRDLKYSEPDSEAWRFRYRPNGDPSMFTILGTSLVLKPAATGQILLAYYAQIPALATNAGNWLLTKCPDLYLYRSLAEAYIYQKNDVRAAEFLALSEVQVSKAVEAADTNKMAKRPNSPPPGDDTGTA